MAKGLDVGTSFLITGEMVGEEVVYKEFRDAFYRMKPASPIAAKMMAKGLANSPYYKDEDGSYVVLGSDAIAKAIERHESASRPLSRGVISPTEPAARQVLKYMLTELVGKPSAPGEKLVYSVSGEPVDQGEDQFNTEYHGLVDNGSDWNYYAPNALQMDDGRRILFGTLLVFRVCSTRRFW